jgi:hypothetical protein
MNINQIDPSYVFCKIILAFPKDYIYISENGEIIELLKSYSNKPPYVSFLGRIMFQRNGGKITCPSIENTIEEMKGFMLVPDEKVPNKYHINRAEVIDFVSKFSNQERIDDIILRKLAKDLERKINSKWDYKTIVNQNKNKIVADSALYAQGETIRSNTPPLPDPVVSNSLAEAFASKALKDIEPLGVFGDANSSKDSTDGLIEGV